MTAVSVAASKLETRSLLRQTFIWMTIGLIFTAILTWYASQADFLTDFVTEQPVASLVGLGAWFVLTLGFGFFVRRVPVVIGALLYFIYCAFMGLALSGIFVTYTDAVITYALVSTVGLFVIMTAFALLTSIDLTRWWMYIVFAILGMILATVLNTIFFQSEALDLGLSVLGVGLFSISTAATVQKVVKMEDELEPRLHDRAALIGAMMLYVNFINLFVRLLELYSRTQKNKK